MLELLKRYVRINTAHPRPDYKQAIALFRTQALVDGFGVKEIELPSGNPVLIITLPGMDPKLPSLVLNHHMDVVPVVNPDSWKFPPFQAVVENNVLYGRGTQDCKGLGVVHYGALRQLKQYNKQLARTVHMFLVPDEEVGGYKGTKEFLGHPIFKTLNVGYFLDEGMPSGNSKTLFIKIDEKTPVQIQVISNGSLGHASKMNHHNAIHELVNFLSSVVAYHNQQSCRNHACQSDGISMHITSLVSDAGLLNVIPEQAKATIDIRVPSRIKLDIVIGMIDRLIAHYKSLSYEIIATSKERCTRASMTSNFYCMLVAAIERGGVQAQPFEFEATTDARFYCAQAIEALGFTPFKCDANLHGTNESITFDDLEQGISIIYEFLLLFCTQVTI